MLFHSIILKGHVKFVSLSHRLCREVHGDSIVRSFHGPFYIHIDKLTASKRSLSTVILLKTEIVRKLARTAKQT